MKLGLTRELPGTWIVARREIRDQLRDWRILAPIIILTLFFPLLMNITASAAVNFVEEYGATIIGDRLIPFLLMVVGFYRGWHVGSDYSSEGIAAQSAPSPM